MRLQRHRLAPVKLLRPHHPRRPAAAPAAAAAGTAAADRRGGCCCCCCCCFCLLLLVYLLLLDQVLPLHQLRCIRRLQVRQQLLQAGGLHAAAAAAGGRHSSLKAIERGIQQCALQCQRLPV